MSFLDRVRDLVRRPKEPPLSLDSPGLEVVVTAFDMAEADSAALARSPAWAAEKPAVLRHHLLLPPGRVAEAAKVLAQDGWALGEPEDGTGGMVLVHARRVQVLDALHCAQERSRMAGLAQRLGGDSLGWDALQPGTAGPAPGDSIA
ncbi:ribonuclease E inhibitor RraB [Amycolatopsis sp. CA-230715]|uniref:ribonuclease E inhibitor RraB n=1 Tax=Amycolatopsis sp. CA-230715 TaxID=2745196 RepID=UPI001C0290EA|nr:ribonuclease E inhibitor RraB [Amycolatopsis sp. CA-230715]QWF78169.1 hypothetical protein HUW46_01564 [Amycolatopsis sp. CA-230715]